MVDDTQNKELLLHATVEGTPRLKFHCRAREVGEHVGYSIEPVLKQKIDSRQAEMESILYNSTPLEKVGEARR
jgi:hypothetical protein